MDKKLLLTQNLFGSGITMEDKEVKNTINGLEKDPDTTKLPMTAVVAQKKVSLGSKYGQEPLPLTLLSLYSYFYVAL